MAAELPWTENSVKKEHKGALEHHYSPEEEFEKYAHWKRVYFTSKKHQHIVEHTLDLKNLGLNIMFRHAEDTLAEEILKKKVIIFEYLGTDAEKFSQLQIEKPKNPTVYDALKYIKKLFSLYKIKMIKEEVQKKEVASTMAEKLREDILNKTHTTIERPKIVSRNNTQQKPSSFEQLELF